MSDSILQRVTRVLEAHRHCALDDDGERALVAKAVDDEVYRHQCESRGERQVCAHCGADRSERHRCRPFAEYPNHWLWTSRPEEIYWSIMRTSGAYSIVPTEAP